jgi:hypothetical protein
MSTAVHCDHVIAGGGERAHEQSSVRLGRDHHVARRLDMSREQLVEATDALEPFWQPHRSEPLPEIILDEDVMMRLRPVVTHGRCGAARRPS